MSCGPVAFDVSPPEDKLGAVLVWHLPLFVTDNFVFSFFHVRSHAFMCMSRTRTAKRSSGLRHRWFLPTILVFLLRNFGKRKQLLPPT